MLNTIMDRRSIRKYTDEPVSENELHTLLECAMLAPSAADRRTWRFIIVDDRQLLDELSDNWQQSIAAVYEAGKALDEQTRSWLYSVFVQLGKIAVKNIDILPAAGKAAWEKLQGFLGRSGKDAAAAEETAKA